MTDNLMITPGVPMFTVSCYKCGAAIAIPQSFVDSAKLNALPFYCQNGHIQWFLQSDGISISMGDRVKAVSACSSLRRSILSARSDMHSVASTQSNVAGLRENIVPEMQRCE